MKINQEVILYYIEYNNKPIYIGSTFDIHKREQQHNSHLNATKMAKSSTIRLYNFLWDKIDEIKLIVIKKIFNDILLLNEYTVEWRRYIEEEKLIRKCFCKKIQLLNMRYPCKNLIIDDKVVRREIEDTRILIDNDYYSENKTDMEIYEFNKKSYNNEILAIEEIPPATNNNYIIDLFTDLIS